MSPTAIKDIYAGMPDAKDEISTNQISAFLGSFVVPPALPVDSLLDGRKFLVSGYKGVGKTSVLYYLQNEVQNRDASACTSFIYFKSDFEEVRKSNLDAVAKKLTALIDVSGEIQPNKIEFCIFGDGYSLRRLWMTLLKKTMGFSNRTLTGISSKRPLIK